MEFDDNLEAPLFFADIDWDTLDEFWRLDDDTMLPLPQLPPLSPTDDSQESADAYPPENRGIPMEDWEIEAVLDLMHPRGRDKEATSTKRKRREGNEDPPLPPAKKYKWHDYRPIGPWKCRWLSALHGMCDGCDSPTAVLTDGESIWCPDCVMHAVANRVESSSTDEEEEDEAEH